MLESSMHILQYKFCKSLFHIQAKFVLLLKYP